MVRLISIGIAGIMIGSAAAAQDSLCEQWWYTRNLIFDRAGYCFSSPLGAALFDNGDCTTTDPQLSPEEAGLVEEIRFMESEFECAVDTSASALQIFDPASMAGWTLDVPVPSEYGTGCFGYDGPEIPLYARRTVDSGEVARIIPGSDVFFSHFAVGDWIYVSGNGIAGAGGGWAPLSTVRMETFSCKSYAG